ncbi:hypothetical protein [Larkinella rosea]|uniref:Uncharacterized protein n=1 Tax=Larkinella rosea TaxID=2025312 RepID=A0A3P1BG99_9BACT|nr:hypothetical protein [Larkinella rosea]RRB00119.1 hypothetical protein EHT25_26205 [Larkinella rosea]
MLQTFLLQSPADHQLFIDTYRQRSQGITVDLAFLKNTTVRVFQHSDQPGEWIAGYFVNDQRPHRYFSVIPAEIKAQMLEDNGISEDDVAEIGAIWMDVKALGRLGRWQVYLFMLADAYSTNRSYIVGGTVHAQIRDFQMQVVKHPLFEGKVELSGQVQQIWEYYANREEIWFDFLNFTVPEMRRHVSRETVRLEPSPYRQSA